MFILNIPEPCHQSWDEMSPEAKGRFCGSCQKIVVDFTAMSDEQVKNYLLDKQNTNTCGRFYATQIGRPLENKNIRIDPVWYQKLPFTRQVFYAVAVFFVLGVSSCEFKGNTTTAPTQDSGKQINTIPQIDTNIEVGEIAINEEESLPAPPKANVITYSTPVLTGDVAITVTPPPEVTQGAPIWQEEPVPMDTLREIKGKIKPIVDSVKAPEQMIMGGIALPEQIEKDSSNRIKKPRR